MRRRTISYVTTFFARRLFHSLIHCARLPTKTRNTLNLRTRASRSDSTGCSAERSSCRYPWKNGTGDDQPCSKSLFAKSLPAKGTGAAKFPHALMTIVYIGRLLILGVENIFQPVIGKGEQSFYEHLLNDRVDLGGVCLVPQ